MLTSLEGGGGVLGRGEEEGLLSSSSKNWATSLPSPMREGPGELTTEAGLGTPADNTKHTLNKMVKGIFLSTTDIVQLLLHAQ